MKAFESSDSEGETEFSIQRSLTRAKIKTEKCMFHIYISLIVIYPKINKAVVVKQSSMKYRFWKNFIVLSSFMQSYYYLYNCTLQLRRVEKYSIIDITCLTIFFVDIIFNFFSEKHV
jgi:hypothetical protein